MEENQTNEYVTMQGLDTKYQVLVPYIIHDDLVNEINSIMVLAKFEGYEVIQSQESNLYNLSFVKDRDKFTITLSCMQQKLMMLYIFSIYKIFENTGNFNVNINDNKNMISSIEPLSMVECLRFFKNFIVY